MADISVTAASFIPSANATLVPRTAGGTLTRGMPLYLDTAAGTVKQLDVTNTTKDTLDGLACEDVAAGQQLFVCQKDPDLAMNGLTSGDTVWCSATGVTKTIGDLTTGWRIISLGVAKSTTVLNFNPSRGGVK